MTAKKMAKRKPKHNGGTTWNIVTGFILLATALLLLLALLTYDPRGIPSWMPLINLQSGTVEPYSNWAGVVGACVAGYLYFFFGAAAFLWVVVAGWFGFAKLAAPQARFLERLGWSLLMVASGAALFQMQTHVLTDWAKNLDIFGPGGWMGYILSLVFNTTALGIGAPLIVGTLYVVSLILAIGFHPIAVARELWTDFRTRREAAKQLETLNDDALEKRKPRKKKAKKDTTQTPDDDYTDDGDAPRIIDANAPQANRPTLADLEEARRARLGEKNATIGISALHLENYQLPPLNLLDAMDEKDRPHTDENELRAIQHVILDTLEEFGIQATAGDITHGPTITRYEIRPVRGVRVANITQRERDIARATRAMRINILAPIPGKDTVGIEIANAKKVKVTLRELLETEAWVSSTAKLPLALGKDVYGNSIIGDLAKMPHCLVAGTTGSGKSVCINSIIASLVFRFTPEELRFIMIDPKVVELQIYNRLPHLVTPVVTDPKKVLMALKWVIDEMEMRYKIFAECGVRNIEAFNKRKPKKEEESGVRSQKSEEAGASTSVPFESPEFSESPDDAFDSRQPTADTPVLSDLEPPSILSIPSLDDPAEGEEESAAPLRNLRDGDIIIPAHMPFIVVIVDELADLMQTAPAEVEGSIARITQMARAAGIHCIVATQTPRADVVTGVIKANIPTRIAFQVASGLDSRVILDQMGAEKLLGQGDMMYLPPGSPALTRAQGVFVTDEEIARIVDFVAKQAEPNFEASIHEKLESSDQGEEDITEEEEELYEKCLEIMKQERRASTSLFQRRLRLGYGRSARIVDIMERRGIVGPKDGARDREILVDVDSL